MKCKRRAGDAYATESAGLDRSSGQDGLLVARKKRMRQIPLTIPEVAFIAGTRGALGAGVGLLLSG